MRRRLAVIWSAAGALLLLNVFASLPALAGGGCHPESPEPSSARAGRTVTVPVKGCEFGPTVVHVPEDATVTWVNHDEVPHTVTGVNLTWGSTDEIARGEKVRFQFAASGTFPYYCTLHPGMAGAVVVGDGSSDDIVTAPAAIPPSSGSGSAPREDPTGGPSAASTVGFAVLALVAGVGAGVAIRSRRAPSPKQLAQT